MPEFTYQARTLSGEDVTGTLVAANKRETLAALSEKSLFPMHVESTERVGHRLRLKRRITRGTISGNLAQLADLLENGVPLLAALQILSEQATHPDLTDVLADVRDQVADGKSLDVAFAAHPQVFDELTVNVVRAGSEGAFLEDALKRTASFLELQEELKSRVTGAMAYPVILAIVGFALTVVLIVFFVPRFGDLFERLEQQGGGLPTVTVVLLGLSDFLGRYGVIVAVALVGLGAWLRWLASTDRGRLVVDRWKLKIPVAGKVFLGFAVSRFCRVLGTLLRNGVSILKALEISSESTGNRVLALAIRESAETISAGETLSKPLAACGVIPRPVMAMIRVAEESNTLDDVLINIADTIDRRLKRQLDLMVRLLEPLMLLVMGGVILFVLSALLLPIFDMSAAMGDA